MAACRFRPRVYYIRKAKRSSKTEKGDAATKEPKSEKDKIMDMKPKETDNLEVGTVDVIAEEVKKFLMELFTAGLGIHENVHFPDIAVDTKFQHNPNLDCPCLLSSFDVRSKYGNATFASMEIYAQSGDVEDIFQVLLQMEVASFNLEPVDETYLAAVEGFLTSNPYLRTLSITNHYFKKDQDLVQNILKSSKSLSTLVFNPFNEYEETTDATVDQSLNEYFRHIHDSQSLKKIDLSKIRSLTPVMVDGLVEGLSKSPKIITLDMSNPYIAGHVSLAKLAETSRKIETFEEWNVGGRIVEDVESILQCAKLVECSKSLKKLDLRTRGDKCWIHPDTWISFGKALSKTSSLQYLDITHHQVSKDSWKAFGESLKANSSLLTFKASRPDYYESKDTDILLPVFEALRDNQSLQSLELSNFDLSDSLASLKALESALIETKSLKSLALSGSNMGDEGVVILSRSLSQMKGIEKLDLSYHGCTSKGAQIFAEGMRNNFNILLVDFGSNYEGGLLLGYVSPIGAKGFEKEYHEIEYYARMNRKGRRYMGNKVSVDPSLWAIMLEKAWKKEKPLGAFMSEDVRSKDWFAGDHDTSIDAVFYLLRDVFTLPVETE